MDKLKNMKESLVMAAQSQISTNLQNVDTEELGAVIDMIKDLSEAVYYCSVVEAMEGEDKKGNKKEEHYHYYTTGNNNRAPYDYDYPRRLYSPFNPWDEDLRYYSSGGGRSGGNNSGSNNSGGGNSGGSNGGSNNSSGGRGESAVYPMRMPDYREGRSGERRRTYMEGKESHLPKEIQIKELENYMKELSSDVTEMIHNSSPEEKEMLKKKMTELVNKIN